jgi:riboflavin kinase, archaea type
VAQALGARSTARPPEPEEVSPHDKEALKQIALIGGIPTPVEVSSSDLAKLIGCSQQTASRRIIHLVETGLLERELGVRKQLLRISAEGLEILKQEAAAYRRIFELSRVLHLSGVIASGVGEGQYYMSQDGYRRQFLEKLGIDVYPGTLNVELAGAEVNKLRILKSHPGILIESFRTDERTFGEVFAWHASIAGRPCAAILPRRSHYTRVIEVIAAEHLRSALGLEDGTEVELRVEVESG